MKSFWYLLALIGFVLFSEAQSQQIPYNPTQSLGIQYRSEENPYYWKNDPPRPGYWQQDVHYKIEAELDVTSRIIDGHQVLIYYNNSPDTLDHVYFHLYQNAFQEDSYADLYRRSTNSYYMTNIPEEAQGGTEIDRIVDGAGQSLQTQLDNTILQVDLNRHLLPGDSTIFEIDFKTIIGRIPRRLRYNPSHGYDQFTITQWYPRISVYDHKFSWTTDQHLGHEFYGNFGTFEVDLTLPNDFIVAATGYLVNRNEVLPPELMEKLDIRNFKDKPYGETPSKIIERIEDSTKTWRYKAVNVHDFAWTADPTYRIGVAEWDGIKCYSFAREWKAAKWQDAAQFTADVVKTYSKDFGRLGYHKMIVVDADQGMEYPMITMDGGTSPGYYGLLAHEVGHNWFFGMVGTNETYQAYLDEGFTSFIENWCMEKLVHQKGTPGKENYNYESNYRGRSGDYLSYYGIVKNGTDAPLTIHSDKYNLTPGGAGVYGEVYYKGVVMLYALQYVLGKDLFQQAMAHYFDKWKFCHPYSEDFRHAIIEYTDWNLNWFFDQWLNKGYAVDYALESFHPQKTEKGWEAEIEITRKGKAIMPLDLVFHLEDGSSELAVVPVCNHVKKHGDPIVLPKWYGWGDFNDTYKTSVPLPAKPVSVEIDPSRRLADCYWLDNDSDMLPRFQITPIWKWDWPLDKYLIQWYPKAWYNNIDGALLGFQFRGGYLNYRDFGDHQISFSPNVGANFPQHPLSYTFQWREPIHGLPRSTFFNLTSRMQYGYVHHGIVLDQRLSKETPRSGEASTLSLGLHFSRMFDLDYLWTPGLWNDRPLNTLRMKYRNVYRYGPRNRNSGTFNLKIATALAGTPDPFSKVTMESIQKIRLGELDIHLRGVLGYATAAVPAPEAFYANMGSPVAWVTNPWFVAKGTLPRSWGEEGHIHPAGGGNLRGYNSGIFSRLMQDDQIQASGGHNRLLAANLEVGLWNPFNDLLDDMPLVGRFLRFDLYAFSDVGTVHKVLSDYKFGTDDMIYDAGIGIHWNPRLSWRVPTLVRNLLQNAFFRLDFPLYVSDPPADEEEVEFRWVLGFGRAF